MANEKSLIARVDVSHLPEPRQVEGKTVGHYHPVEIAEIGVWYGEEGPTQFDPGRRDLWYVAGLKDGRMYMSKDRDFGRDCKKFPDGPIFDIHPKNVENFVSYKTIKKLEQTVDASPSTEYER